MENCKCTSPSIALAKLCQKYHGPAGEQIRDKELTSSGLHRIIQYNCRGGGGTVQQTNAILKLRSILAVNTTHCNMFRKVKISRRYLEHIYMHIPADLV